MVRPTWVALALTMGAAQLACQAPSPAPAPTKPPLSASSGEQAARTTLRPNTGKRALRLATWNMQWLAEQDGHGPVPRTSSHYAQLAQIAERLDADVIAVQEVESAAAIERVFTPQKYTAFISDHSGAQDVGFVVRQGIKAEKLPDVLGLNVGGVRPGADLLITVNSHQLRLLSVHLKSGCFRGPLKRSKACSKLSAQVRPLEEWIDAREREGTAYAVLGDFNREFYSSAQDEVWRQLDDADPIGLQLWSPTSERRCQCWDSRHPAFVDHLVLGRALRELASTTSFQELLYPPDTQPKYLSDHCPLSIDLGLSVDGSGFGATPPAAPATAPSPTLPASAEPKSESPLGSVITAAPRGEASRAAGSIKGNIGSRGKKLYHLPECPSYAGTKIDPGHGERWFQSEPEAQAAGWTKSPNCP